jgi:hypothetical protein
MIRSSFLVKLLAFHEVRLDIKYILYEFFVISKTSLALTVMGIAAVLLLLVYH